MSLVALRRALLGAVCLLASAPAAGALAASGGHLEAPPIVIDANPAHAGYPNIACAKTMVYASRGSSENNPAPAQTANAYYDGLGTEMVKVWDALRSYYGSSQISLVVNSQSPRAYYFSPSNTTVSYPALSGFPDDDDWVGLAQLVAKGGEGALRQVMATYAASVDAGTDAAVSDLMFIHNKCKTSNLVILGYSEGADVTRRALDRMADVFFGGSYTGKVVTMLFGDTLWSYNNEGPLVYSGNTTTGGRGVIRRVGEGYFGAAGREYVPPIPTFDARWNATSWCRAYDIACQSPGGTTGEHTQYGEQDALGASARAAAAIYAQAPTIRPVVTAKLNYDASCLSYAPQPLTAKFTVIGPPGTTQEFHGSWNSGQQAFPFTTVTVPGATVDNPAFPDGAVTGRGEVPIGGLSSGLNWNLALGNNVGGKLDARNKCG